MQKDNCRVVQVSTANGNNAAGDNILVPANQLGVGIGSIRVWQVALSSSAGNTIVFRSGAVVVHGPLSLVVSQDYIEEGTGVPWAECKPGQPLIMNNSAGGTTSGQIWYTLA